MSVTVSEPKIFLEIFNQLKTINQTVNLEFLTNGLHIQTTDTDNTVIFDMHLDPSWFASYEITDNTSVGVHTKDMWRILGSMGKKNKGHEILIALAPEHLNIVFQLANPLLNTSYDLPTFEFEYTQLDIPSIEYDCSFTFDPSTLSDTLKRVGKFGKVVTMSVPVFDDQPIIHFTSHDLEKSTNSIHVSQNSVIVTATENVLKTNMTILFDCKKLIATTQFKSIVPEATGYLKKDIPFHIKYALSDTSFIKMYIAPRND